VDDRRYDVVLVASARRALLTLPPRTQRRVIRSLRALESDPRPHGAVPLAGQPGERIWGIRVGDYRVLYELHDDRLVVLVIRIGHRRDVYR
jgi:mRNA interferase RelE/StbE